LPPPPLANGFHDDLRAVLLSGWYRIAHTSASQRLSRRFARRIAQRTAAHCSFFRSSTAFPMVRAPYRAADGSGLLIPPLVNGFRDGLRAVLLSGRQRIAHSSARQRLSRRFARRIAQRLEAHCSFLHSLTAFPTVRAPYCSADGSRLLILPLVNGFKDGLRAVLRRGWQRIAHTSARQRLSRRFARRIAQQTAAYCSFFRSPTAFTTVCAPQIARRIAHSSARRRQLSPAGLRAVLLSGWQRITHSSARQRLSRRFARRIAQRMVSDWSIFRSPTAFTTICAPQIVRRIAHSSARRRQLSPAGLRTVFLSGWQRITHSSARQRISRRFASHIAQRMAADCSYLRSSTAFTTVCAPYCSADGSGLLNLPLANSFQYGLRAVFLSGWYRIAPTSARQRLSRRFARRIAQRMASHCSHLR